VTGAEAPRHSLPERILFSLLTRGWDKSAVATYSRRLRQHDEVVTPEIVQSLQTVDGKATGLLTHSSLMIAGLGLVAPLVADNDVEIAVVIAEISVYLLLAVGCLRCLAVFHAGQFSEDSITARATVLHELIIRRELYSACNRIAICFTIIVFVLLPILFLWKPGK